MPPNSMITSGLILRTVLAVLLTIIGLVWVTDLPRSFGLLLYTEQYLLVVLGIGLAICFLNAALDRNEVKLLPLIIALAGVCIALGVCLTAASDYEGLLMASAMMRPDTIFIGVVIVILVIIGVYFAAGGFLAGVVVFFVVQSHFAGSMPGFIQGRSVTWERIFAYLSVDSTATLGLPLNIAATTVFAFIVFGVLISRLGGGEFFTDLAMSSVGKYRGGSAKAAVVGSGLFGSVSGSAVANIVATGVVTIPLMKRAGYSPQQAGAVEAVASTGGQLLPPIMGAAAFLMAEFLQVSYGTILFHALVPALLYYFAILFYVDLVAGRDKICPIDNLPKGDKNLGRRAIVYVLPFAILLFSMFNFNKPPEISALYGAITLIVLRLTPIYRSETPLGPADFIGAIGQVGQSMVNIIVITAAAGIVIGLINISGSAFALSVFLIDLGGTSLFAVLVVTAVVSVILGMGMPTVGVYVLLATLAAPAIVDLGVEPIAAHLFVLYFGLMSMLTPPVAVASYVAASVAGGKPVSTSLEALKLGWVAFTIPFLFVYSPSLILIGEPFEIALTVASALAGVWLIAAAFVGFSIVRNSALIRVSLSVAGAGLLLPINVFEGAIFVNGGATAIALAVLLLQFSIPKSMERSQ